MVKELINRGDLLSNSGFFDEALEKYEKALSLCEENTTQNLIPGLLFRIADLSLRLSNYQKAEKFFSQLLKVQQRNGNKSEIGEAYSHMGYFHGHIGEWEKALDYFNKSLNLFNELRDLHGIADQLSNMGRSLRGLGQPLQAIDKFTKAMNLYNEIGEIRKRNLIKLEIEESKKIKEEGIEDLLSKFCNIRANIIRSTKGEQFEPLNDDEMEKLRELQKLQQEKSPLPFNTEGIPEYPEYDSLKNMKVLLGIHPDKFNSLMNLFEKSLTSIHAKKFDPVLEYIYQMIEIEPKCLFPWMILAHYGSQVIFHYHKPLYDYLVEEIDKLATFGTKINPDYIFCWAVYSMVRYLKGDYISSLDGYNKGIERYPQESHSLLFKGLFFFYDFALIARGNYDYVIHKYKEQYGLKFFDEVDDLHVLSILADCYELLGDTSTHNAIAERYIEVTESRLGSTPGDRNLWNMYGWYHAKLGQSEKAIKYCKKALSLPSESPEDELDIIHHFWNSLGLAYKADGNIPESIKCYEKAIELSKSGKFIESRSYLDLGDIYAATGNAEKAKYYYSEAFRIDPKRLTVRQRLKKMNIPIPYSPLPSQNLGMGQKDYQFSHTPPPRYPDIKSHPLKSSPSSRSPNTTYSSTKSSIDTKRFHTRKIWEEYRDMSKKFKDYYEEQIDKKRILARYSRKWQEIVHEKVEKPRNEIIQRETFPKDFQKIIDYSQEMANKGEKRVALNKLKAVFEKFPDSIVLVGMILSLYKESMFLNVSVGDKMAKLVQDGLDFAHDAIIKHPQIHFFWMKHGDFNLYRKNYRAALTSTLQAYTINPYDPEVVKLLAEIYTKIGRYENAEEFYKKAFDMFGDEQLIVGMMLQLVGVYRSMGNIEKMNDLCMEVLSLLEDRLTTIQNSPILLEFLIEACNYLKKFDQAANYGEALKIVIKNIKHIHLRLPYSLCETYIGLMQYDKAEDILKIYAKVNKDHSYPDTELLLLQAKLHFHKKEFQQMDALCIEIIEKDPQNVYLQQQVKELRLY